MNFARASFSFAVVIMVNLIRDWCMIYTKSIGQFTIFSFKYFVLIKKENFCERNRYHFRNITENLQGIEKIQ